MFFGHLRVEIHLFKVDTLHLLDENHCFWIWRQKFVDSFHAKPMRFSESAWSTTPKTMFSSKLERLNFPISELLSNLSRIASYISPKIQSQNYSSNSRYIFKLIFSIFWKRVLLCSVLKTRNSFSVLTKTKTHCQK